MTIKKSTITIIVLFAVAALISWPSYFNNYAAPDTVNIHAFPLTVGEWTGREIPISDNDYKILETRNAFARMYTNPDGDEVMLYMIYSQHNRKVAHPPEICFTGGGATIITKYPYDINYGAKKPLTLNRVLIDYDTYQQIMYYWFKIGTSHTPSYWKQQMLIGLKTLLRQPSSSAMVRVTALIKNDDEAATALAMDKFVKDIMPMVPEYLK